MATIVTLKSVNEGLYTVEIKREFDSITQTREFTKEGLNEYVEGLKQYCQDKGYEFIYREEITKKEAYAKFDDIGAKVADQELGFQKDWAENAGKEMTCRFFIEDWVVGEGKSIAVIVYWNGEAVETYKFGFNEK